MFEIIAKRKTWMIVSGSLMVVCIFVLAFFGLKIGIDFTGGSLLEVDIKEQAPTRDEVEVLVSDLGVESVQIQSSKEAGYIIRTANISNDKKVEVMGALEKQYGEVEELRFDSIGPTIGKELQRKGIYAIIFVLIGIILYIAYVFRKVSFPVSSWKYGLTAIITLAHDLMIVIGAFVLFSYFFGAEADSLFITALLTILGYSVNDTIVVFDRIRGNLLKSEASDFQQTVNLSLNQTIVRSLNTSVTTLLVLLALAVFGGLTYWYKKK